MQAESASMGVGDGEHIPSKSGRVVGEWGGWEERNVVGRGKIFDFSENLDAGVELELRAGLKFLTTLELWYKRHNVTVRKKESENNWMVVVVRSLSVVLGEARGGGCCMVEVRVLRWDREGGVTLITRGADKYKIILVSIRGGICRGGRGTSGHASKSLLRPLSGSLRRATGNR